MTTGAAVLGAVAVPEAARGALAAAKTQAVYKLVPNGHTCRACLKHDVNKLFPTAKAANGKSHRADLRSARTRAVLKNHAPVFPKS